MLSIVSKSWRIIGTGFCFLLFGMVAFSSGVVFTVFIYPLPLSRKRKQCWVRYIIHKSSHAFVSILSGIGLLNFELSWFGEKERTIDHNEGKIIISNHPTLLDVIFIISVFPNVNCVVKRSLWSNPLTFAIITLAGYIPNNIENLIEVAAKRVREGERLIIFPEATRTQESGTLDFKRGAAHIAILADRPITPVVIECNPLTLRKHQPWYQVPSITPVFSLRVLPEVVIADHIEMEQPRSILVRRLTKFLIEFYERQLI